MSQGNPDHFPSLDRTTEYMVPGPGMSAVQPWLLPAPEQGDPSPRPEHAVEPEAGDGSDENRDAPEPEAPAAAEEPPSEAPREPAKESPAEPSNWHSNGPAAREAASSRAGVPASIQELPPFLQDELVPILSSAQQAASQILERARLQAREEFAEVQRERERIERRVAEIQRERRRVDERIAELTAWNDQLQPMVRWFQGKMEEIRSRVDELPDLIRKGLDPLATAVATMDPNLSEMSSAASRLLSMEPLRPNGSDPGEPTA